MKRTRTCKAGLCGRNGKKEGTKKLKIRVLLRIESKVRVRILDARV